MARTKRRNAVEASGRLGQVMTKRNMGPSQHVSVLCGCGGTVSVDRTILCKMFKVPCMVLEEAFPDATQLPLSMVPSTAMMEALIPGVHDDERATCDDRTDLMSMLRVGDALDPTPEWIAWFDAKVACESDGCFEAGCDEAFAVLKVIGGMLDTKRLSSNSAIVRMLLPTVCYACGDWAPLTRFMDDAAKAGMSHMRNPALPIVVRRACDLVEAARYALECTEEGVKRGWCASIQHRLQEVALVATLAANDAEATAKRLVNGMVDEMVFVRNPDRWTLREPASLALAEVIQWGSDAMFDTVLDASLQLDVLWDRYWYG